MVLAHADQAKYLTHQRTLRPLLDWRVNHTRWVICRYPTHGMAQAAGMSLEELEDHVFGSCNLDWGGISRAQEPLKRLMERTDRVRIEAPDTNLSFSNPRHPGRQSRRTPQLPDGEVFTAPSDDPRGTHRLQLPDDPGRPGLRWRHAALREGQGGRGARAGRETRLNRILDVDGAPATSGEFAFGLNSADHAQRCATSFSTRKIFGSVHLALGNALREVRNGIPLLDPLGPGEDLRKEEPRDLDGKPVMVDGTISCTGR